MLPQSCGSVTVPERTEPSPEPKAAGFCLLPPLLVGGPLPCRDLVQRSPFRFHPHVRIAREHGARDVAGNVHGHLIASTRFPEVSCPACGGCRATGYCWTPIRLNSCRAFGADCPRLVQRSDAAGPPGGMEGGADQLSVGRRTVCSEEFSRTAHKCTQISGPIKKRTPQTTEKSSSYGRGGAI